MTAVSFNKKEGLIIVPVTVKKGNEIQEYEFAVDTGATTTLVDSDVLHRMGYAPSDSTGTSHTVTASKTEIVHEYSLDNMMSLGIIKRNFKVIARSLPIGLGID